MRPHEFDQFSEALRDLALMFPRRKTTPEDDERFVRSFWRGVSDLPMEVFTERVDRWKRFGKKFPTPADLRPTMDRAASTGEIKGGMTLAECDDVARRFWDEQLKVDELGTKLKLCEALSARYDTEPDQSSPILAEKRSWLRQRRKELKAGAA